MVGKAPEVVVGGGGYDTRRWRAAWYGTVDVDVAGTVLYAATYNNNVQRRSAEVWVLCLSIAQYYYYYSQ